MARALVLGLLGALVGLATVLTHARPPGLALGLLATVTAALALPGGWSTRLAFATGWVLALGAALLPRSGGGFLIGSDAAGYTLLVTGLVLLLAGIVTVRPLRPGPIRRPGRPDGPAPPGDP